MQCEGHWEFECCGGNNVEFQREDRPHAIVYEGECFSCRTRYQVVKFKKREQDEDPEWQPYAPASTELASTLNRV